MQTFLPARGQRSAEIDRRGSLADSAFLIDDRDPSHGDSFMEGMVSPGIINRLAKWENPDCADDSRPVQVVTKYRRPHVLQPDRITQSPR